ncbi:MAG: glycosyltransferase [Bacteroidales bacterium]|nr:glycosyltransferase [Bacteroidales bacterium]
MKRITIIVATYNAEKTIARCLDSIVKQKGDIVELVVVDGASKDRTIEILEHYKDSIDVIISEPDKGLYDAWNKGVKSSTGEWIMFVGADDMLTDDAIESYHVYLNSINTEGIDLITAKSDVVDEKGNLLYKLGRPYVWNEFRKVFKLSHGSSLHNRLLFEQVGLFDISYKICADYELLLRKKLNTLFLDKKVFIMQDGGMSTTLKALDEAYRAKMQHNAQSFIGANYLRIRGRIGMRLRTLFPILKKLK